MQTTTPDTALTAEDVAQGRALAEQIGAAYKVRVVGMENLRWSLLVCLIAGGHLLIESVPGLAKTTAARTLAGSIDASFHRIQCTPDLMPSDIVGSQIYDYSTGKFHTELGPVHANFVLLDEINRANAKTQSALLEAMAERQTTIAGQIHPLPTPFMVLATQNPIEQEGTYDLPEAQLDRFLLKEVLRYPDLEQEIAIMERLETTVYDDDSAIRTGIGAADVRSLQQLAKRVYVDRAVKDYIGRLVAATRPGANSAFPDVKRYVEYGASPRASIAFMQAARALALLTGRTYVIPDDVAFLRYTVLRHRIILTYEAIANSVTPEKIIDTVFAATRTP
jgi:MoxR-like ATPase